MNSFDYPLELYSINMYLWHLTLKRVSAPKLGTEPGAPSHIRQEWGAKHSPSKDKECVIQELETLRKLQTLNEEHKNEQYHTYLKNQAISRRTSRSLQFDSESVLKCSNSLRSDNRLPTEVRIKSLAVSRRARFARAKILRGLKCF